MFHLSWYLIWFYCFGYFRFEFIFKYETEFMKSSANIYFHVTLQMKLLGMIMFKLLTLSK